MAAHAALHAHTPTLTVVDPRGLQVRSVAFYRARLEDSTSARIARSVFDSAGRRVQEWDPRLGDSAQQARTLPGNLWSVFSLAGKALLSDSVDAGVSVELMGEAGQWGCRWNASGHWCRAEYDASLRLLAVFEGDGTAQICTERLTYGDASDGVGNRCGQLVRHDDPAGSVANLAFGLTGNVIEQTRRFLSDLESPDWPSPFDERDQWLESQEGARTTWRFGPADDVLEQIDAMGNVQSFAQTVLGQLKSATLQLQGQSARVLIDNIQYDAQGRITSETAGNGVVTVRAYDPVEGRLVNVQADDGRLENLNYIFDPVGNVLSIEDLAQPARHFANQRIEPLSTFFYDTLYQLIEATGYETADANRGPGYGRFSTVSSAQALSNYNQQYEYDAGGNLQKLVHVGARNHTRRFAISSVNNHSVLQAGEQPPDEEAIAACFDACGNLRELQPGQTLSWDWRNQLSQVTPVERQSTVNDSEVYRYDAAGVRVRKVRETQTRAFTHFHEVRYLPGLEIRSNTATGESLHVVIVAAGHGNVRALHWTSPPPGSVDNDQIRYSLTVHLGCATLELDAEGGVISHEIYYPFGETAWFAGRSEVEARYKTVRYSGQERDATRLYYYGLRFYAPWLMRWINPDPAGAVDGLNLYRFVRNNPSTFEDVMGMIPWDSFESEVDRTRLKAIRAMEKALTLLENDAQRVGDKVMERFFGRSDTDLKSRFMRDIEKTIEVAKATKARNFELIKDRSSSLVAEVDMAQYRYFSVYPAAKRRVTERGLSPADLKRELFEKRTLYAQERKTRFLKVGQRMWNKTRTATNANYMAQVLIHEFSHAAIYTRDFAYGKAKEGVDPTPLFELATGGEVEPSSRGADFEHRVSVSTTEQAYTNADSFAAAVMFLKRARSRKAHETSLYRKYVESR